MKQYSLTLSGFFLGTTAGAAVAGKLAMSGSGYVVVSVFVGLWGAAMVEGIALAWFIGIMLAQARHIAIERREP